MPEVEPKDCLEKCDEFQMKSKFVSSDYKEKDKMATYKYYETDPIIKIKTIKEADIIDEFTRIIIEAYNDEVEYPKEIKAELEEMEEEDDYDKLFNMFTFTNDERDYISNEDLRSIIQDNKIPFILKKCKMILKTKGTVEYRSKDIRGISGLVVKGEQTAQEKEEEEQQKLKNQNKRI
jgi:hypothetical protein